MRTLKVIAWILTILGIGFGVIGLFSSWFGHIVWYDEVIHTFTTFAITLLVAAYAHDSVFRGVRGHGGWMVILVAGTGLALGVLWEIAEWAYDSFVRGNLIKEKYDTMVDLTLDGCGALVAALIGLWVARAARQPR